MLWCQCTIAKSVECEGIGLHTGRAVHLQLLPMPADFGVIFVRIDQNPVVEIEVTLENLVRTTLATTLGCESPKASATVSTVEHLLASFLALGIDNVKVLLDGPEVPILDGSALGYVKLLDAAGRQVQSSPRQIFKIGKDVTVHQGTQWARALPGQGLHLQCTMDAEHPMISNEAWSVQLQADTFRHDIAPARNFGFATEAEALQHRGLVLGSSLDNAVVFDGQTILNKDGLRFSNEMTRHAVLDLLGDIALLGMPVEGHFQMQGSGHGLSTALVEKIMLTPDAFEITTPQRWKQAETLPQERSVRRSNDMGATEVY